jgi:hypothetical protein
MIRIDEIYSNTFWPYIDQNRPGTRVFFCDPPGHTDPEHVFNHGRDDCVETDYVFMHDQEPIHLDEFENLFNEVLLRNFDLMIKSPSVNSDIVWPTAQLQQDFLEYRRSNTDICRFFQDRPEHLKQFINSNRHLLHGHVIISEQGEYVHELCERYGWTAHYYFYHGWACLDWFRGYDQTYLIARARDRKPTKTFMSPNRIVAGKRDHRVLFLYNVFKNNLQDNHISAPRTCQYEGVDISAIASKYNNIYPDIEQVFESAELPRLFAGEDTQLMHSYQLGNFTEAADSLIYVPTETVYFGQRTHLTEKTFKAIALEMPFVLVAPQHSLEYLRSYGFRTFAPHIDESYDSIEDPVLRIERVTQILLEIQARSAAAKNSLWQALLPIVEYNWNHFYRGGFRDILEAELKQMLNTLCSDS